MRKIMNALLDKRAVLGFLLAFIAAKLNTVASDFIMYRFPSRAIPNDILFDLIPHLTWAQYFADAITVLSLITLIIYIAKRDLKNINVFIYTFAVVYAMRAFINILTPLGQPLGDHPYGLFNMENSGMFPSGHTAMTCLCFFMISWKTEPRLKAVALIFWILEMFYLIVSRGHYTVDLVGGIMISYIAYTFVRRYSEHLIIKKDDLTKVNKHMIFRKFFNEATIK